MIKVGITGQAGFVGTHLYNELTICENIECIPFRDEYFEHELSLREFVRQCNVIIHLAALNRHESLDYLYATNIRLVQQLISAMEIENVQPYIIFSSSSQEELDNKYGLSKIEGRKLLEKWANKTGACFSGLVVPNVYGPFGKPNYNSFIATFCNKLINNESPEIITDNSVKLIYVGSLCSLIIKQINIYSNVENSFVEKIIVPFDLERKVSEILYLLKIYKRLYVNKGIIPPLKNKDEINLFNTFRSYIDHKSFFPVTLNKHEDNRGLFVETVKLGIGGQVSFSTTFPGVTRGNHFHTRKIERFTVIKGKALIQLRKIGTNEIFNFELNGNFPSYVDMPIWYTHNIKNIGEEELYTQFWINEWYNPDDGDTYFEEV